MGDRHADNPPRGNRTDDEETREFFRTMATGQQQVAQALQALTIIMERMNPPNRQNEDQEDNISAIGSQRAQTTQSRTADRPTRPTFFEPKEVPVEEVAADPIFVDTLMAANEEWELLAPQVRERITFERFVNQRREHYRAARQDRRPRIQNNELKRATGKLSLTTFDGSSRMTTRAWIHKLYTYLALRPMIEVEAIKYATLHLEVAAHDWWYHGMVTL